MKTVRTLAPVRPSAAIEVQYRRRLLRELEEMHNSIIYWLRVAYKRNKPKVAQFAQDARSTPATRLRVAVKKLANRWLKRFDETALRLANYFAQSTKRRSDAALKRILKKGGFSVKFQPGPATQDVMQSIVAENVSLIKSIPQQYLTQVEGLVMRSVQTGRDLESLTKALQRQFGVTKRRATLIARDQNNKATAAIQRVRQLEMGIEEAVWVHSGGGKEPRPSHVKAGRDKVKFNLATGWWDPDEQEWILPGQLINCRCVAKPVIPGFT